MTTMNLLPLLVVDLVTGPRASSRDFCRYHVRGRTGSAWMVHGNCVSVGCFAMTDSGIEQIYTLCDAA